MNYLRKRPLRERIDHFLDRNVLPFCVGFFCGALVILLRIL